MKGSSASRELICPLVRVLGHPRLLGKVKRTLPLSTLVRSNKSDAKVYFSRGRNFSRAANRRGWGACACRSSLGIGASACCGNWNHRCSRLVSLLKLQYPISLRRLYFLGTSNLLPKSVPQVWTAHKRAFKKRWCTRLSWRISNAAFDQSPTPMLEEGRCNLRAPWVYTILRSILVGGRCFHDRR